MTDTPCRCLTLDDKPFDSHYLYEETIIEYPIAAVWSAALDIGSWMSAHRLERLAGTPGEIGSFERVYPQGLPQEIGDARYHLYGIAHIVPQRIITLEVLSEKGGSYGDPREWASFDTLIFTDMGERTRVAMFLIDVHPGKGDAAFHARQHQKLADLSAMMPGYFNNLRDLVAANG